MLRASKNMWFALKKDSNGQSFVELAIVLLLLIGMLAGVVEAGNLLNQYINLVDGAREAARAASNASPFILPTNGVYTDAMDPGFYQGVDVRLEGSQSLNIRSAIAPIVLDSTKGDDVVISVYAISNGAVKRFPQGFPNGWSVYGAGNQPNMNCGAFPKQCITPFTDTDLNKLMTKYTNFGGVAAPNSGMVVVEVFYHYQTILQMVPQIPVHAYAIMPLTAAEATPTP